MGCFDILPHAISSTDTNCMQSTYQHRIGSQIISEFPQHNIKCQPTRKLPDHLHVEQHMNQFSASTIEERQSQKHKRKLNYEIGLRMQLLYEATHRLTSYSFESCLTSHVDRRCPRVERTETTMPSPFSPALLRRGRARHASESCALK